MFSMTDENWRKNNKALSSRLKFVLHQQMFTDVICNVQGREFKSHRLLLALGSPYFEKTFYHRFKNTESSSTAITISDVCPEVFQTVLNFLYTDKVTFGNEKRAFQTYEAASKFKMSDLMSECEIYLSELKFRPVSVWYNLEQATALDIKRVKRKCTTYIQNHTCECLRNKAFLSASSAIVLDLVQWDTLAVSETELMERLAIWLKNKSGKDRQILKVYFSPFLKHIRFKAIRAKDFCNFIATYPDMIDKNDCLDILRYLELPNNSSLPKWCCTLSNRVWPP